MTGLEQTNLQLYRLYGVWDLTEVLGLSNLMTYQYQIILATNRIRVLNQVNVWWRPQSNIYECIKAIKWNENKIKELKCRAY